MTGAGSGIGAASAARFAAEGAAVVAVDIRQAKAQATVDSITDDGRVAMAVGADVADAADVADVERMVAEAVAAYGRLDVLYSNAGTLRPGTAVEFVRTWLFTYEWSSILRERE